FVFFFFQAEDGIRDRNVTGVQTCALPICAARHEPHRHRRIRRSGRRRTAALRRPSQRALDAHVGYADSSWTAHLPAKAVVRSMRSEERRVGKECRCGGSEDVEREKDKKRW